MARMSNPDKRLCRHLTGTLILKAGLLTLLWFAFARGSPDVNGDAMFSRLTSPEPHSLGEHP
jgi:hypothetical protein